MEEKSSLALDRDGPRDAEPPLLPQRETERLFRNHKTVTLFLILHLEKRNPKAGP